MDNLVVFLGRELSETELLMVQNFESSDISVFLNLIESVFDHGQYVGQVHDQLTRMSNLIK